MEMLGQYHDRVDRERVGGSCGSYSRAQRVDMFDQRIRPPIGERDREEVRSTPNKIPPVSNHVAEDTPAFASLKPGYIVGIIPISHALICRPRYFE